MRTPIWAALAAVAMLGCGAARAEPAAANGGIARISESAAEPAGDAAHARKLALARRYFAALHYQQTIKTMLKALLPALIDGDGKRMGALSPEAKRALTDAAVETMDSFMPRIMDDTAEAMSQMFTEEELTKLSEFYETDIGQSIIAKNGQFTEAMSGPLKKIMPEVSAEMVRRMCRKYDCSKLPKPQSPHAS